MWTTSSPSGASVPAPGGDVGAGRGDLALDLLEDVSRVDLSLRASLGERHAAAAKEAVAGENAGGERVGGDLADAGIGAQAHKVALLGVGDGSGKTVAHVAILGLTRAIVKYKVTTIMIKVRLSRPPSETAGPGLLYPRFFLAGIAVTLTAGATWGAWLLVRIARARDFAAPSIFEVNAHGQAQIYGWMGLFILGFALQMFPAFWGARLAAPRLARALLPLMAAAIAVRAVAEARPAGRFADLAVVAGGVQLAVVATFVALLAATARRGAAPARVADRYLGAALAWFLLGAVLDLRHLARTVAPSIAPRCSPRSRPGSCRCATCRSTVWRCR